RFLSSPGDINGDGFDDVIVGNYDRSGPLHGATIVFGRATDFPATIDGATLTGSTGFQVVGMTPEGHGADAIAVGDFNGDGIDDIVLGDPGGSAYGVRPGVVYLIYGQTSGWTGTFDVSTLNGTTGFQFNGASDG